MSSVTWPLARRRWSGPIPGLSPATRVLVAGDTTFREATRPLAAVAGRPRSPCRSRPAYYRSRSRYQVSKLGGRLHRRDDGSAFTPTVYPCCRTCLPDRCRDSPTQRAAACRPAAGERCVDVPCDAIVGRAPYTAGRRPVSRFGGACRTYRSSAPVRRVLAAAIPVAPRQAGTLPATGRRLVAGNGSSCWYR